MEQLKPKKTERINLRLDEATVDFVKRIGNNSSFAKAFENIIFLLDKMKMEALRDEKIALEKKIKSYSEKVKELADTIKNTEYIQNQLEQACKKIESSIDV